MQSAGEGEGKGSSAPILCQGLLSMPASSGQAGTGEQHAGQIPPHHALCRAAISRHVAVLALHMPKDGYRLCILMQIGMQRSLW